MTTSTPSRPTAPARADAARLPRSRTSKSQPREPADLTAALPPAFEAFCALNRDSYLDYARAHLPHVQAHRLVRGLLGELAVGWLDIVGSPNPQARAWTHLRTRVQLTAPALPALQTCSPHQYDALVLHCRLGYTSAGAAAVMGLDASKIRYLVLSATSARRQAVRHLHPRPAVSRAA
ncbi:hypothetical protein [Streptomyces rishiriensis]|uniref:Rhodanese-related sulfurtransferase n=1 Tax=Streptomyces rishiriensis TaxID=68264 RepID=A0ABU0P383_STRRH|nr:hypothetical protein [Streptomyces rishiriensis]MDQ0585829.1 rhodanese-related sulfurtransferase [Streptomyces rishiriensis]